MRLSLFQIFWMELSWSWVPRILRLWFCWYNNAVVEVHSFVLIWIWSNSQWVEIESFGCLYLDLSRTNSLSFTSNLFSRSEFFCCQSNNSSLLFVLVVRWFFRFLFAECYFSDCFPQLIYFDQLRHPPLLSLALYL